jgi:hypothetical protein
MSLLMVVPVVAVIGAMVLHLGTFLGFFLAGFTTVITSLAAVVGLVLLL